MGYSYMHLRKLNKANDILFAGKHNLREMSGAHIDDDKSKENEDLIPLKYRSYEDAVDSIIAANKIIPRKNNVKAVEVVLKAVGELGDDFDWETWKQQSIEWVKKKFGEENIVHAVCHNDEATPHLHVVFVPILDGKLNASEIVGYKTDISELVSEYAAEMASLGLDRGKKGAPRQEYSIPQLRHATAQVAAETLPEPNHGELIGDYYKRANAAYIERNIGGFMRENQLKSEIKKVRQDAHKEVREAQEEAQKAVVSVAPLVEENKQLKSEVDRLKKLLDSYGEKIGLDPSDMQNLLNIKKVLALYSRDIHAEQSKQMDRVHIPMEEWAAMYKTMSRAMKLYDEDFGREQQELSKEEEDLVAGDN